VQDKIENAVNKYRGAPGNRADRNPTQEPIFDPNAFPGLNI
jgi:hypothetical protein